MSEILVRVVDKTHPDIIKDVQLLKSGDVVVIMPDNWSWSEMELTNPEWRILNVGLSEDNISRLLMSESSLHMHLVDDVMRQARASYIDFISMSMVSGFSEFLNDDQRILAKYYVPVTFDFNIAIRDKQRRQNPHEIG